MTKDFGYTGCVLIVINLDNPKKMVELIGYFLDKLNTNEYLERNWHLDVVLLKL